MEQSSLQWRKLREGLLDGSIYLSERAYDVSLYFEDGSLYSHLGVLSLSEVIVDEQSGSLAVRAIFDNPDHLLLPGMAVTCKVNGGVAQNIMTLPPQAVMRDPKGNAYVYTVQGEHAVQTPVTLGELYNDGWRVLNGLDSSFEVVVSGSGSLRHGSKVRVVNRDGVDITLDSSKPNNGVSAPSLPAASGLNQSAAVAPSAPGS